MTDTTDDQPQTHPIEHDGETQNPPIDGKGVGRTDTLSDDEDKGVGLTPTPASDDEGTHETRTPDDEPETFPREYVEKLRDEAAQARLKAKRADDYAHRLHTALVAADGRLVAPDELAFDEAHLEDPDALAAAIGDLVKAKPYLAARRVHGDVGQGTRTGNGNVDLASILRAAAG